MKTIPWISRPPGGSVFRRRGIVGVVAAVLMLASAAQAFFVPPYAVPVDRLVKNAEAYLAKHPQQPYAHYTLARIHYLAFHVKRDQAPALACDEGEVMPVPAPQWMVGWVHYGSPGEPEAAAVLTQAEIILHAACAAQSFAECLRLRPENGLGQLGLASFAEEFITWKERSKPGHLPEVLRDLTLAKAREAYSKAFALAIARDSQIAVRPLSGLQNLISYEAGMALIRLAKEKGVILTDAELADLKLARDAVAKFQALPAGSVTPIVFSLQPAAHLADLLAPETVVDFDLRGYGWREQWPWVKPTLGILVWDPLKTGRVTSARELFGGYTFQIFRETGYDALAALDDNGDRALSGAELAGISVWFDRNGNGKSDPGEVTPLSDLGVTAISVTATTQDGIHPTNPRGIVFKDGRVLPTWDWMVQPVKVDAERLVER